METPEIITLVFTCNNHFALMLGALLKSIIVNHKSEQHIQLFIINDNISLSNKNRINQITLDGKLNVTWLESAKIFENIKLPIDNSSFPRNVYMRLFIPSFLPLEIKKAIYLDADMICCTDISKLWKIDLGNFPVAAVKDRSEVVSSEWGGIPNYEELNLDPNTPYFNTGLIVFNMDLWREESITQAIINAVEENIKYANFPDQYGFNVVLASKCLTLDFKWNCYSMLMEESPNIIHFIGNKPIYQSYKDNQSYATEFYKYLELTAWRSFKPYSAYARYWNKALNKIKNKLQVFKSITK
ncbi:lipopolysaccharide biosynthesis glycosyltransferase [Pedobacter sp. UYP24]